MSVNKFERAVAMYRAGKPVVLRTHMGSCQCGDTQGVLLNGSIFTSGKMDWQRYVGPIEHCQVGYGMATLAKAIAAGELSGNHQCTGISDNPWELDPFSPEQLDDLVRYAGKDEWGYFDFEGLKAIVGWETAAEVKRHSLSRI